MRKQIITFRKKRFKNSKNYQRLVIVDNCLESINNVFIDDRINKLIEPDLFKIGSIIKACVFESFNYGRYRPKKEEFDYYFNIERNINFKK